MKDINDFYLYYEEKLRPLIEENANRVKAFRRLDRLIAAVAVGIGFFLFLFDSSVLAALMGAVAIFLVYFKKGLDFYPEYRIRILSAVISFIDNNLSYRGVHSLGVNDYKNSGMKFGFEGKYEISDAIAGKVDGVIVNMACVNVRRGKPLFNKENVLPYITLPGIIVFLLFCLLGAPIAGSILGFEAGFSKGIYMVMFFWEMGIIFFLGAGWMMENMPDNEEGNLNVYIFKGIFLVMDFNKNFSGSTVGISKAFGVAGGRVAIPEGAEIVDLENKDFMGMFRIYATNQQEARYLLTPALMEALYSLKMRVGKPMSFSFRNEKLYIVFAGVTLLDVSIFQADSDDFVRLGESFVFISDLLETVKSFGLHTRLWTKW